MMKLNLDQDFEVVVDFTPNNSFELQTFYDRLADIGTSIQVGEGDDVFECISMLPQRKNTNRLKWWAILVRQKSLYRKSS